MAWRRETLAVSSFLALTRTDWALGYGWEAGSTAAVSSFLALAIRLYVNGGMPELAKGGGL